jgi:TPR repeat protein
MKMKWCVTGFLLLVLCASVQLRGQQNDTNSIESIKADAQKGNARAQYDFGNCYYNGAGVPQDYAEAVKWFRKAADQGIDRAQNGLGVCYQKGQGVTQDYTEAVKWYRKAADQGNDVAQLNLGDMYFNGQGISQNFAEAAKWYHKAADQGNPQAQYNFGVMCGAGNGVPQDAAESVKWYRKAADQGYGPAQSNLGAMCFEGQGVTQDYAEAVKWWRKAAEQNDVNAEYSLGVCYANGASVETNYAEAVKWWHEAAEQGHANAQYNLGASYANGDGVTKNYIEAYKWESLAAAQGVEIAKKYLLIVEIRMTPEQVAEAQRLAASFVTRKETPGSSSANSASPTKPSFTGTGFFITEDGYLVSNYHVVKNAAKVRLLTGAGLIDATVVKVDAANDLALLKAVGKFTPLPVAASRGVKLGGTVATVGFPNIGMQGFSPKLAKGEIASLSGAADDARYFQISVPVQPGNSGGALVDARGNVVGVVSAKLDAATALAASGALPENVNYAVKSSFLLSFLESVPAVSAKLKAPITVDRKFEDVVKSAQDAAVLVLVY